MEQTDFVHGSYDLIYVLNGEIADINRRIIELRMSLYIRKTEILICFDIFMWDEFKKKVDDEE